MWIASGFVVSCAKVVTLLDRPPKTGGPPWRLVLGGCSCGCLAGLPKFLNYLATLLAEPWEGQYDQAAAQQDEEALLNSDGSVWFFCPSSSHVCDCPSYPCSNHLLAPNHGDSLLPGVGAAHWLAAACHLFSAQR